MSQWILIALFLLAHPLMMLFMHKGMHGGSGSMGGCGNNTQQNSNNTEKPRKKVNQLGGIYYMKILTGSRGDEVHEHLYENGQRRVGHRILKKNTVTNNGEFHPVPGNIVLIPLKGTVKLTTPDQECTIKNGQLAILGPTDSFYLTAIDDVEFVGVVDIK